MSLETIAIYLWFSGVAVAALSGLWLWINAFRTHWGWGVSFLLGLPVVVFVFKHFRRALGPLVFTFLGVALISAAVGLAAVGVSLDLGERETIVGGEKHIILTGWDKKTADYQFLLTRKDVVVLKLANPDVDDKTLEYLAGMTQLRELDLNDSAITDTGLAQLQKLPALQNLELRKTNITDEGFRAHLLPMASLEKLNIVKTGVTKETAKEWKAAKTGRKYVGP